MKEQQYHLLCGECDEILLSQSSTVKTCAIRWLHILREHPIFLSQYEYLFREEAGSVSTFKSVFNYCRKLGASLLHVFSSLFNSCRPWYENEPVADNIDVLFISHFLSPASNTNHGDFYYGELPDVLANQGTGVGLAYINQSKLNSISLVSLFRKEKIHQLVLGESISFHKELSIMVGLLNESLSLLLRSLVAPNKLRKELLKRASEEALSASTHTILRIAEQIGLVIEKSEPRFVVLTYEGHAWERIIFEKIRREYPQVRCIAYQHAAIFKLQHSIRRSLGERYEPHYIFTAGRVSMKQLEDSRALMHIPLTVLGSNRCFRGENYEVSSNTCLVLPEGLIEECNILFEISLKIAKSCPHLEFIWRLHPLISFEELQDSYSYFRDLPVNICLSESSLESDMKKSRWALYRGSTAIISAVMAGLRPLYMSLPGEMSVDPLYMLEKWKLIIGNEKELKDILSTDCIDQPETDEKDFAIKLCREFYMPMDSSAFQALL